MAVLITGSTGLIGSRLALRLAEGGVKVHALCRSVAKAGILDHRGIKTFYGDLNDAGSLEAAMEGVDKVFHLAAFTGVWHPDPDHYIKVNTEGTRRVIEMAACKGAEAVVVTSTAGVMGASCNDEAVDELSPVPEVFFTRYEESKMEMEKMLSGFSPSGMRIVIVNPSRLYGPGILNRSNSVTKMLVRYLQGRWHLLPGGGGGIGNYAYIDDVVEGHIKAIEKGLNGRRYILGGENMSYRELFRRAGEVAGRQYRLFGVPLKVMLAAANVMEKMSAITGNEPLITPGWVQKYNHNWVLSSSRAEEEIGYSITPFEEGVRGIIKHFNL